MSEHRGGLLAGLACGVPLVAVGVVALLGEIDGVALARWAGWFVGADVAHDAVVAPVAGLVGLAVSRAVPRPLRAPVRAGLFASAVVVAVGWLPFRHSAAATGNPTIQPLSYGSAILTVLGVVWAGVASWGVLAVVHARRGAATPRGAHPRREPTGPRADSGRPGRQ